MHLAVGWTQTSKTMAAAAKVYASINLIR